MPVSSLSDATGSLSDATGGRWRWAWAYAAAWLVFLVPPFLDAVRSPNRLRGVAGAAVLALFVAVYLHTWVAVRARRLRGPAPAERWRYVRLAAGVTLAAAATALVGQSALATATFVTVMVMFLLPSPARLVATAALIVVTFSAVELVPGWSRDPSALQGLVLTAFIMWSIVQIIERNAELAQAQDRLAELAVNEERARFARDLHDLLGHSLTLLAMKAELAGRLVRIDPEHAEREIAEVERLARDALADVRSTVGGYRQASLAGELVSARAVLDAAGIEAELPTAVDEVPGERRELLGWAVREGVTNVVRHSRARRCRIVVDRDGVEIVDDGRGPAPPPASGGGWMLGSGLRGLRERAEAAGATVVVGAGADGGFRLRVGW